MSESQKARDAHGHTLEPLDVLVLGSGVAGLSAALRLATGVGGSGLRVGVLTKGELSDSATRWAQGGVAAVLEDEGDSTELHFQDTLRAGAGLCDEEAVRVLVEEGPDRVRELIALGARFDRESSGTLSLAREGGHSRPRVIHAGGVATGVEVERALVEATRRKAGAVLERWFASDLIVEGGRCRGVFAFPPSRRPCESQVEVRAENVILATGGAGQMFAVTTNPPEATGDGVAMALRAGVAVGDIEFVQFHPTALHHPAMPRPLISEALRGHGALLKDPGGRRFVDELAPRDVVSRAMALQMLEEGVDHLWLDVTGLDDFSGRFPNVYADLVRVGLDPSVDWLPVAPAAHHLSGGVITDLWGATSLNGLSAAGEVACTGVHGANRLASNSLLEGMVFGARVAEAILNGRDSLDVTDTKNVSSREIQCRPLSPKGLLAGAVLESDVEKLRDQLQRTMTAGAGVVRSADSIERARVGIDEIEAQISVAGMTAGAGELYNLITLSKAVLCSSGVRRESRGAHFRIDHPDSDDRWKCRLVVRSSLAGV